MSEAIKIAQKIQQIESQIERNKEAIKLFRKELKELKLLAKKLKDLGFED